MRTPYDTALRIAQRRLDEVRSAIGAAVAELQRIEQAEIALVAALKHEMVLAGDDPRLTAERYFGSARDRRQRLSVERAAAQERLEALRLQAVEHYGEHTAIDGAASGFRIEAVRIADAAEQAAIDDMVGRRQPVNRIAVHGP